MAHDHPLSLLGRGKCGNKERERREGKTKERKISIVM